MILDMMCINFFFFLLCWVVFEILHVKRITHWNRNHIHGTGTLNDNGSGIQWSTGKGSPMLRYKFGINYQPSTIDFWKHQEYQDQLSFQVKHLPLSQQKKILVRLPRGDESRPCHYAEFLVLPRSDGLLREIFFWEIQTFFCWDIYFLVSHADFGVFVFWCFVDGEMDLLYFLGGLKLFF